jgi:hypothetical protein
MEFNWEKLLETVKLPRIVILLLNVTDVASKLPVIDPAANLAPAWIVLSVI